MTLLTPQLASSARALTCGNGRISRNNNGPRRVLVTPPGHGRSAEEIDMTQVTPACARPTRKYPEGRAGTSAGYSAHRSIGEAACDPCRLANNRATAERAAENAEHKRRHYAANREHYAYKAIRIKYSLTREQYDALLKAQDGGCAICGTTQAGNRGRMLNVDHDHACCPGHKSCGACVRGLLCARCNVGLGAFQDDSDRMVAAAAYLMARKGAQADAVH